MGLENKGNPTVINHLGAAKEAAGKVTGNEDLERQGQRDQAQAKVQEAGEKVKDAAAGIGDNLKDAARKLKDGLSKD
ncbi:CsbD family protein [Arthrobacter sp. EPSL27]|uniref:CsbD family protein n=1 Tax=Arthrobacter sp. EPSL27 TaxID=1745378 RepID=UPI000747D4CF|nr:CsbD family protein [Arthrobacter sp. EPSL27]KUM33548.1 CsbD family protein [Arthrobacter sp. EPSL27]